MKTPLVLYLSLFLFCISIAQLNAEENVKLKVLTILPLTGEAAGIGEAFKNGMSLALEKLPKEQRENLEFLYENDELSPKTAVSVLTHSLATASIDAVINLSSATGKAIAPLTEARGIPFFSISSDASISKGRRAAFNFWVTPEEEIKALLPEMRKRKIHRIARFSTIVDGVIVIKEAFDAQRDKGTLLVVDEDLPPEERNFRPYISKIKAREREIDGIMLSLFPGQLGTFAKQVREAGIRKPIFGTETLEDRNEVEVSGGALIDAWYVNASDGDGTFLTTYKKRFPKSSSFSSASGHDAVLLFAQAAEKNLRGDALIQYLSSINNFTGALGTYSSTNDHRFTLPAEIKVVTKDGFVTIGSRGTD